MTADHHRSADPGQDTQTPISPADDPSARTRCSPQRPLELSIGSLSTASERVRLPTVSVDLRPVADALGVAVPERPASATRSWSVVARSDVVSVVAWGRIGTVQADAIAQKVAELQSPRVPLVIDLTGVTELHPDAVTWLGARHVADGPERPLLVEVVADGHLHRLLTHPDAPRLRLRLL